MNSNNLNSEKLLYKIILQFAVYSRETNKLLDPYLASITQNLKSGSSYQQLTPELLQLSKALSTLSEDKSKSQQQLKQSYQEQQRYFLKRLHELLSDNDLPLKFQTQCNNLKSKISDSLDDETFKKVVDSATKLLNNIKIHAATEQRGIEAFLAAIPKQLNQLEQNTIHVSESNQQSIENRESLNDTLEQQFDDIKTSTSEAKELSSLQQSINQYVLDLSSQFKEHKESEDQRQIETQKQLDLMSQKLQEMETESESLRNNLRLAHDKATRDPLTGLPNRLAFDEKVTIESNRWKQNNSDLSLIIWDIDLFKLINDNFGHKAGDKTLILVSQLISKNCRGSDLVARFGGEEFVMIMPDTSSIKALEIAENIREIIANTGFNHNGKSITLTISCGISEFSENDEYEQVFERADQALYYAKEHGRNQCSVVNKEN